ncbi:MAG: transaldolase family protein [Candidatus Limnocylindrales bacterium]
MTVTYFEWLRTKTPNRAWINNPTASEIGLALAQGAVSCTTNPAYGGNLLGRAPAEIEPDIAAVVAQGAEGDEAVALVQERLVGRILPHFAAIHEATEGQDGWVSLQGAPELDTSPGPILAAARRARALGENCIPKIPATGPGLAVMETLVAEGQPVLMTEVFSLAQVARTCERYLRATDAAGTRPVFIMAPITGIFGDHLRAVAARDGLEIEAGDITWAGVIWARAAKRLVDEHEYPVRLLYGGARSNADLVDLVGGGHASTVNWSTFADVLEADPERRETVDEPVPADIEARLRATFDDFRRALELDGLEEAAFEEFGPVQHFRDAFITGWRAVRDAVEAAERQS